MKKLEVLFHVGYGKTATTWMQRQVFPVLEKSLYLGKNSKDVMYDESFNKLHYQLFEPLYGNMRYRSRNSSELVRQYAVAIEELITDFFTEESGGGSVVISNETILGYGNYNAELNALLLKRVIDCLKNSSISDDFILNFKVLVVFREQVSYLQSSFAYGYALQSDKFKTISEFLSFGLKNHHDAAWGALWVDEVADLLENIFSNDNEEVTFLPYELLKNDPELFLERALVRTGIATLEQVDGLHMAPKENVNHRENGMHNIRDLSRISKMINRLATLKKYVPNFAYAGVKDIVQKISMRQRPVIKGSVRINEAQSTAIRELFRQSNTRMAKRLDIDLTSLGYATENKL